MYKILLLASGYDSMEAAYTILNYLKSNGYQVDVCNSDSKEDKIKADVQLVDDLQLSGYSGVACLDTCGEDDAVKKILKKAKDSDMVVGGLGEGVRAMLDAGVLGDETVCSNVAGMESRSKKKFDAIDSPCVRSDNVVTSNGDCPVGFAVLLVDALGGKIHKIVESGRFEGKSILVVAPPEDWFSFNRLARSMAEHGRRVIAADWDNVDIKRKKLRVCALIDSSGGDVVLMKDYPVPERVWLRQETASAEQTMAELESIGCKGANSRNAISIASSPEAFEAAAAACYSDSYAMTTKDFMFMLFKRGGAWRLSSGDATVKVARRNSVNFLTRSSCKEICGSALEKSLFKTFPGRFKVTPENNNRLRLGDQKFVLSWSLSRTGEGWAIRGRYATSDKIKVDAQAIMRLVLPDEMADILDDADAIAELVAIVLQSLAEPDDMSELGIDMLVSDDGLELSDILAVPEMVSDKDASRGTRELMRLAEATGNATNRPLAGPSSLPPVPNNKIRERILEREMAHEGMWIQPNGKVAVREMDDINIYDGLMPLSRELQKRAIGALEKESDAAMDGEDELQVAQSISRKARHRFVLVLEMMTSLGGQEKTAGIYPSSVAGPYAHLELPMHERVFEWHEGDDWLVDREKSIQDQTRYNPEYMKSNLTESAGFYAVWPEEARGPTSWMQVLQGDTPYKTRNLLAPGKLY